MKAHVPALLRRTAAGLAASYAAAAAAAAYGRRGRRGAPFVSRMDVYHHAGLAPVLAYLCLRALSELPKATAEERMTATNRAGWQFFALFCCHAVVHSALVLAKPDTGAAYKAAMLLHHAVAVSAYSAAFEGTGHFWGLLLGCCEVTGVFLNGVYLLKELGAPQGLQAANGVALWATWVAFRLALFPFWLLLWWRDAGARQELADPGSTFHRWSWAYPGATLLLLALSLAWFVPIHRGCLRSLRAAGSPAVRS